jgi:preprotein translocase subunit SecG
MKEQAGVSNIMEKVVEVFTIIFLISLSVMLITIFQTKLQGYDFYIHFFYLPIVLSTFWWGKKGITASVFLGIFLVSIAVINNDDPKEIFSAVIEAILFFIIALLVSISSDKKSDALKKEMHFKLDTAHYFFNPICIAEGNIDLAMRDAPDDIKRELEEVQKAVQRIKKVVENTVVEGKIRE